MTPVKRHKITIKEKRYDISTFQLGLIDQDSYDLDKATKKVGARRITNVIAGLIKQGLVVKTKAGIRRTVTGRLVINGLAARRSHNKPKGGKK